MKRVLANSGAKGSAAIMKAANYTWFLGEVFPKLQWNISGHPRCKKNPREDGRPSVVGSAAMRMFENCSRSHVVKLSVRLCLKISVVAF